MDKISLIIPCYNEQESLPYLREELKKLINNMKQVSFEVIFVDNSSNDETLNIIKDFCKKEKNFRFISFSRNFGKDSSMYAGLKASTGDYVAILDADLQDPPELVTKMYDILKREDYDCVAAYRKNRHGEPFIRSFLAEMFYKIMERLSKLKIKSGARDFRLMTRQMVNSVLLLEESERFTKGIFSWVGFKTKWLPFENHERVAGKTKLPTRSAMTYAIRGVTSFSTFPLVFASIIGMIFCIISIIYMLCVVIEHIIDGTKMVPGYPTIVCIMLLGFGLVLLVLGIIGQYLATIYLEIKNRPKYIVKEKSNDIDI